MTSQDAIEMKSGKSIVGAVAFNLLQDAELDYKTNGKFSDDSLQPLHSIFGEVLVRATELLENHKVFVYHLKDRSRNLVKLTSRREEHVLFSDINFCYCDTFRNGVLEAKKVVCEHVLAAKLAEICGNVKSVAVTDLQMKEMLDEELKRFGD